MNSKIISVKCPLCKADLDVEEGQDLISCDYCDAKIKVENGNASLYRGVEKTRTKQNNVAQSVHPMKTTSETKKAEQSSYAAWAETRVKWRNRGLSILLISAVMVLYACFANGGAFFGIAGALGFVVGLIMFGSHLEPTGKLRDPKANSGTKKIVKGAVIGGIVAGEAGAVIGATIAKNKLDNEK